MNTKSNTKNEVTVTTKPTKSVTKTKNTTAVAVVNNTDLTNKSVKSKLLNFDETMQLMNTYNIGSKSQTKQYRIINGQSSLHVLKSFYRLYATPIDYQLCTPLNDKNNKNIEFKLNDNDNDSKRPHTILIYTTEMLKKVFECISKNKLNAPS